MANFEAFHWNFLTSTNSKIGRSVVKVPSSEIRSLCLMKRPSKMLQNLPYFIYLYENPKLLFPFFISCYFIFFPNECPGLCDIDQGIH